MISKLIEKNAEQRYQSAKGIIHDLDLMLSEYGCGNKQLGSVVLAKHDVSESLLLSQTVYGRISEYKTMMSVLDKVSAGRFEILFVTGLSGTGKSVFVMELYKPLAQRRGFLIVGKFDFSKSSPYSALLEAMKDLCNSILLEDRVTVANYRSKIQNAVGEEGKVLTDLISNLHLIIGEQPSVDYISISDAINRFNFVFIKFIRAICSFGRPIILILEDL